MKSDNYKITQYSVSSILNYVENSQIAIPEIQRPFVWKGEEVRALIDSLYEGYPIGYLIVWQNSQVRVRGFGKGGTKKILIDGQQRVTALMAALLGKEVLDEQYQSCRIRIAFNPLAQTGDERFAVCDEKHEQDSKWIPDISIFFRRDFSFRQFEKEYKEANPGEDFTPLEESVDTLKEIVKVKIKDGEIFKIKRYDAKDIKVIKDVIKEKTDSEEKEYQKELKELENLEKKDLKLKEN